MEQACDDEEFLMELLDDLLGESATYLTDLYGSLEDDNHDVLRSVCFLLYIILSTKSENSVVMCFGRLDTP